MYLFKRVADDLGVSPMRRQVSQNVQPISSMLITSTIYTEGNAGEIIDIPIIEITFEK